MSYKVKGERYKVQGTRHKVCIRYKVCRRYKVWVIGHQGSQKATQRLQKR